MTFQNSKVHKKIKDLNDPELIAYQKLSDDNYAYKVAPRFYGIKNSSDGIVIELENLLNGFSDPYIMDIKMG